MKSIIHSPFFFSAYPLGAIIPETASKQNTAIQSPYLKAILSDKTPVSSKVRVLPLASQFSKKNELVLTPRVSRLPKDIELTEKDWFNNYE